MARALPAPVMTFDELQCGADVGSIVSSDMA
jgi:hypothetical protein